MVSPVPKGNGRLNHIVIFKLDSKVRVVSWAHDFVQLLARTDSNNAGRQTWGHCLGQIHDPNRGNLRHENFAAVHAFEVLEHEVDSLLEGYPESGHTNIGYRQTVGPLF